MFMGKYIYIGKGEYFKISEMLFCIKSVELQGIIYKPFKHMKNEKDFILNIYVRTIQEQNHISDTT